MKAIEVKITNKNSKVVATVAQAIEFLQKNGVVVNSASEKHLETAFAKIYAGDLNKNGGVDYSFSAGNNSGNPTIWINDVTGKQAQSDLAVIAEKAAKIISEKYPNLDLRLKIHVENLYLKMEGGTNWYWAASAQRHFPINELWYRSANPTLEGVVKYVDDFVAKYK